MPHYKDQVLSQLAERGNIAQFVSYSPDVRQRFARIRGYSSDYGFNSPEEAIDALLAASVEKSVNVRSFDPYTPEAREFVYGISTIDEVIANVRRLSSSGLYTIVNETVSVLDGGVSGVALGDIIEFAPGDTPRAVEKPGIASMRRDVGQRILSIVYGFKPDIDSHSDERLEFSIHPSRRGVRESHTILWEVSPSFVTKANAQLVWPNRFSNHIGDKLFGLLIAHVSGFRVPHTRAIPRKVAPFSFGKTTGTGEFWLRTCPNEQQPGHFTTLPYWDDPFLLLQQEDPSGTAIASVLSQEGVRALYSGAAIANRNGRVIIEGVTGSGEGFMVGHRSPDVLPKDVRNAVRSTYNRARKKFGPVRFEWVFDGNKIWIVQFHVGRTETSSSVIVPGDPAEFRVFDANRGIDVFRKFVSEAAEANVGILLRGKIGITSHFGDLLRKARVPSRLDAS